MPSGQLTNFGYALGWVVAAILAHWNPIRRLAIPIWRSGRSDAVVLLVRGGVEFVSMVDDRLRLIVVTPRKWAWLPVVLRLSGKRYDRWILFGKFAESDSVDR